MVTTNKLQKVLKTLPDEPGIYLFYNQKKDLLYVGKATSLKNRVRSYFIGARTFRPIEQMMHEVTDISFRVADSVLEAIIMEANAIKRLQPKYNILGRDNKSWNYIVITKEPYPRVETIRQHDIGIMQQTGVDPEKKFSHIFGPYPGLNTTAAMKILRHLFFFSTCKPGQKRPCLYSQMGQCLGVCTGDITPAEYRRCVIQPLVSFLRGKKKLLIKQLERRMRDASKAHEYEEAGRLRDQIDSLTRIHDIALLNKSFVQDVPLPAPHDLIVRRIEGYDISNLGSTGKVGSMVVFEQGEPKKSDYRKFKIKSIEGQSDVDCLEEVLQRRLNHDEWPLPGIFLIDGGKPQVNRSLRVVKERGLSVPVIGIAKGPERKRNDILLSSKTPALIRWCAKNRTLLIRVRDEAHRFAVTYQKVLRKIE